MITDQESKEITDKLVSTFQNSAHDLPVFRKITYPVLVETIADNHPVYVNGTKLVDGRPMITERTKDSSRIEEFKKLGFSRQYIQELTDSSFYTYYFGLTGIKGKKCNYGSSLPYKPSYAKITDKTVLSDPVTGYNHIIEIIDHKVYFNGFIIASAPVKGDNGKKKTLAQQLTFCKAVIYSIIPGTIQRPIKDHPSGCVVYETVPDDEYFRELIAKYPAVIDNQDQEIKQIMTDENPVIVSNEITLPEHLNAYTTEAITGYPLVKDNRDYELNRVEMVDLMEMNHTEGEIEEGYDYAEYDNVMTEFNLQAVCQMYDLIHPANVIRSFAIPHLRLTVIEECVPA